MLEGLVLTMYADATHLLKNLRNCLLSWGKVSLPNNVVSREGLVSSEVNVDAFVRVIQFQENKELKIAPKLDWKCIRVKGFEKMRVKPAQALLSRDTAAAIRYMVSQGRSPQSDLASAFFAEQVGYWYTLMTGRRELDSFTKNYPDQLQEKLSFLTHFQGLIDNLKFEGPQERKPFQKGILISTSSLLLDVDRFLNQYGYTYFQGARTTTEGCENIFSTARSGNPNPSPRHLRAAFKAISLSQLIRNAKSGNYGDDDHVPFLSALTDAVKHPEEEDGDDTDSFLKSNEVSPAQHDVVIDVFDANCMVYLAGYILRKTINSKKHFCQKCASILVDEHKSLSPPGNDASKALLQLLCIKDFGGLTKPSDLAQELFLTFEGVFRQCQKNISTSDRDLGQQVTGKILLVLHEKYANRNLGCHLSLVVRRFVKIRLFFWGMFINSKVQSNPDHQSLVSGEANSSRSVKRAVVFK